MRNTPHALMIFAAGFGTRMAPLIKDKPKPLIEVAGRPLIHHALHLAREAECNPIVANLHYKPEPLATYLEPLGVETVLEHPDILETGGGLRNALPLLGAGPVFTINSDAVWSGPNPILMLAEAWQPDKMDALLICIPPEQAIGHQGSGDFTLANSGKITRGPGMIYGGVQIIKTDLLHHIPDTAFSLNLLWDQMLTQQRLYGVPYPGKWCDVGHPGGITLAEAMLADHDV